MSDEAKLDSPSSQRQNDNKAASRQDRLSDALRQNLRRRKMAGQKDINDSTLSESIDKDNIEG